MTDLLVSVKDVLETRSQNVLVRGDSELGIFFVVGGEALYVSITSMEDDGLLRFHVPGFLSVQGAANREAILERLLMLNRDLKLCCFTLDSNDGEVGLELAFPTYEGSVSEAQIDRCMSALLYFAEHERPSLRLLAATGAHPQDAMDEVVRGLLEGMEEATADGE